MLDDLESILVKKNRSVFRRGTGAAQFLFIVSINGAVEVSQNGDAIWIEFWANPDEEADDPPVKELCCTSIGAAIVEIEEWLNRDKQVDRM